METSIMILQYESKGWMYLCIDSICAWKILLETVLIRKDLVLFDIIFENRSLTFFSLFSSLASTISYSCKETVLEITIAKW